MSGSDNFDPFLDQTFSDMSWLDPYLNPDSHLNAVDQRHEEFIFGDAQGDYNGAANHDPTGDAAINGMANTTTGDVNGNDVQSTFDNTPDLPPSNMQTGEAIDNDDPYDIDFSLLSCPNLESFDDVTVPSVHGQARPDEPVLAPTQRTPATPAGVNDHIVTPSYPPTEPTAFAIAGSYPALPATITAGQYPSLPEHQPNQVLGSKNLNLMRQQQAFKLAGVAVNDTLGGAQPLPTGNGVLDPRLNGGPSDAQNIGDHTSFGGHVNASEEAGPVMPTGVMPTATPGTLRLLAPKPQSGPKVANAATQSTINGTTPAARSILPVKKRATQARKEAVEAKKSVSKAKQEVPRTPVHTDTLLVPTLTDAQRVIVKHTVLKIVNDDHAEVAANYQTWIPRITKPFDADFRAEPENIEKFTAEGKTRFADWQSDHLNKVTVILAEHEAAPNDSAAQYAQGCAWILFQKILDTHTKGMMEHVPSTIVTGGENTTMKCSARIEVAIKALEEYPIVRYDFLKRERLAAIVASPQGFYRKKVDNLFVNYKKRGDVGEVRVKNQDANETQAASDKPTATKKRKNSPLASSDTDEVPNAGDNSLSGDEVARPAKRTKAGSKRVDSTNLLQ
jgi:hypothetical protein